MNAQKLTLGPLVYNWQPETRRDFYFRIADEAPLDEVYLGEIVCAKREPFYESDIDEIKSRLERAGKRVHCTTLALITSPRERQALERKSQMDWLLEANDISAVKLLKGKPFIIGPHITALNEGTLGVLVKQGARRIVFASEISGDAMAKLAAAFPALETEAQVFGRQSVAVSMRCYHTRSVGRDKDHCRIACGDSPYMVPVETLDKQPIWTIAGTQTLSAGTLVLGNELEDMAKAGISHFRLAPQEGDMIAVAKCYRELLDGTREPESLLPALKEIMPSLQPINGFYYGVEGCRWEGKQ
ncbi:MAG: U32 family peptidase [Bdellovibrionales bacterium]